MFSEPIHRIRSTSGACLLLTLARRVIDSATPSSTSSVVLSRDETSTEVGRSVREVGRSVEGERSVGRSDIMSNASNERARGRRRAAEEE